MNKQTLIKLSDTHYIVVDDSEIKEGDWCLSIKDRLGLLTDSFMKNLSPFKSTSNLGIVDFAKKITHSTQPLEHGTEPFGDGVQYQKVFNKIKPLSLSEVEELINGYSVEKMADEHLQKWRGIDNTHLNNLIHAARCKNDFKSGFNAHKELVKDKVFTIKQAEKIFIAGGKLARNIENPSFEEYIQSLLPKTE